MNVQALIPLIAGVAYIPIFVILLTNRPWQNKQKIFLLFLIPAMLWSLSDVFFHSTLFMADKLLLVKFVLCFAIWMMVQYHYFLRSFYRIQGVKVPIVYGVLVGIIILSALDYIPGGIDVTNSGVHVDYGDGISLLGACPSNVRLSFR